MHTRWPLLAWSSVVGVCAARAFASPSSIPDLRTPHIKCTIISPTRCALREHDWDCLSRRKGSRDRAHSSSKFVPTLKKTSPLSRSYTYRPPRLPTPTPRTSRRPRWCVRVKGKGLRYWVCERQGLGCLRALRFFAPCRRRARSQLLLPPLLLCASRGSTHARALSSTLCRLLAANGLPQCARVRARHQASPPAGPPPSLSAFQSRCTRAQHAPPSSPHHQTKPNQPPRQTGNHHHVHRHPETEK